MIDFIKPAKRHGAADIVHAIVNIIYAAAVIGVTILIPTSPWPAIILVILSKWRVVAVRPRYWWANFLASLPDLIFGIGIAISSWFCQAYGTELIQAQSTSVTSTTMIVLQVALGIIYVAWLIGLKPRHEERAVGLQALASQFLGLVTVYGCIARISLNHLPLELSMFLTLLFTFIIAFSAARQAIGAYEEKDKNFLSAIWGLLMIELGYIYWHWDVIYNIGNLLPIPQIAILSSLMAVVTYKVYVAWQNDRKVTKDELGAPIILTVAVTIIILFFFSGLFA